MEWGSWVLQLVFGMLLGFGLGLRPARLFLRGGISDASGMIWFLAGAALIGGAVTSYFGNQLWTRGWIFAPPEPPPSPKVRRVSLIVGALGGLMLVWALAAPGASPQPTPRSRGLPPDRVVELDGTVHEVSMSPRSPRTSSGSRAFLLLLMAFPAAWLAYTSRTGTIFWGNRWLDREDAPFLYWCCIGLNLLMLGGLLLALLP